MNTRIVNLDAGTFDHAPLSRVELAVVSVFRDRAKATGKEIVDSVLNSGVEVTGRAVRMAIHRCVKRELLENLEPEARSIVVGLAAGVEVQTGAVPADHESNGMLASADRRLLRALLEVGQQLVDRIDRLLATGVLDPTALPAGPLTGTAPRNGSHPEVAPAPPGAGDSALKAVRSPLPAAVPASPATT